ncbi:phosphohistidine phosphatase SixA [Candidatus Magnetobacterium casense]|uniref:Phosphohistidine phosphatase SixA n=1 Tax=Candidatus Magnetobacterium casense TaxID=1455061 RepID=A0ABS6RZD0_9BACT|nr:phosphohistidine phosphatase SixA [Candidatus Magnetobacterium casensis]MBV6342012.1 phosphohistidine phosphatase SixA [Candidatus Magnetobacterium casensis]
MHLYLIQHAEAKSEEEDPQRPLSNSGLTNIKKTAAFLQRGNVKIDKIYHSGKSRAVQTAQVLEDVLTPPGGAVKADGLLPLDSPAIWVDRLVEMAGSVAIVGHLPHLSKLASTLLCDAAETGLITFKMAGVLCLRRNEQGLWLVQWMIVPELCQG